jgi:hypothetical protein
MPVIRASALALFIGMLITAPASATVLASFEYLGTVVFADPPTPAPPDLNNFPVGGASNNGGISDIDTGIEDFSARVGFGQVTPQLSYGSGAVAAGGVTEVRSRTQVELVITNDSADSRNAVWNFLIFAGGAGLNTPDFSSAGCDAFAIDQCDAWRDDLNGADVGPGDSASVNFSVVLDSSAGTETLFSGDIGVTGEAGAGVSFTQNFSAGFALDNFGLSNLDFSWDQTLVEQALGLFAPGETKTLTFITESVASSTGSCDNNGPIYLDCVTAYAGYGDPPGGGGRVMYRSASSVPVYPTLPPDFSNGQVIFTNLDGSNPVADPPQGPNPGAGVPAPATSLLLLAGLWPVLRSRRRRG